MSETQDKAFQLKWQTAETLLDFASACHALWGNDAPIAAICEHVGLQGFAMWQAKLPAGAHVAYSEVSDSANRLSYFEIRDEIPNPALVDEIYGDDLKEMLPAMRGGLFFQDDDDPGGCESILCLWEVACVLDDVEFEALKAANFPRRMQDMLNIIRCVRKAA